MKETAIDASHARASRLVVYSELHEERGAKPLGDTAAAISAMLQAGVEVRDASSHRVGRA